MAWSKEIKDEVRSLLADDTPVYRVRETIIARDGTAPPAGTITRWAATWGIATTGKRGPVHETHHESHHESHDETTPHAKPKPKRRTRPNAVPARLLTQDVRDRLRQAVANTTIRLSSPDISSREWDGLIRGLRGIMEMTPDLLSYEDTLSSDDESEVPSRRGQLIELVRARGLSDGGDPK